MHGKPYKPDDEVRQLKCKRTTFTRNAPISGSSCSRRARIGRARYARAIQSIDAQRERARMQQQRSRMTTTIIIAASLFFCDRRV